MVDWQTTLTNSHILDRQEHSVDSSSDWLLACQHLIPLHEHPPCPPPAYSNHSLPPSSQGTASFSHMKSVAASDRWCLFSTSTRWCEVEFSASDRCWTDISQPLVVHHQSCPWAWRHRICRLLSPFWFAPGQLCAVCVLQAQTFLRLFTCTHKSQNLSVTLSFFRTKDQDIVR